MKLRTYIILGVTSAAIIGASWWGFAQEDLAPAGITVLDDGQRAELIKHKDLSTQAISEAGYVPVIFRHEVGAIPGRVEFLKCPRGNCDGYLPSFLEPTVVRTLRPGDYPTHVVGIVFVPTIQILGYGRLEGDEEFHRFECTTVGPLRAAGLEGLPVAMAMREPSYDRFKITVDVTPFDCLRDR